MKRFLFALAIAFSGCAATCATGIQPGPSPIPTAATACDNLARIGCSDGTAPNCALVLQQVVDSRMTPINLGCLTGAADVAAAIKCGGVACQP